MIPQDHSLVPVKKPINPNVLAFLIERDLMIHYHNRLMSLADRVFSTLSQGSDET